MKTRHTPSPLCITERKPSHDCYGPNAVECLVHVGHETNKGNAIAMVSLGGTGGTSAAPEDVRAIAYIFAAAPEMREALEAQEETERIVSELEKLRSSGRLATKEFGDLEVKGLAAYKRSKELRKSALSKATGREAT